MKVKGILKDASGKPVPDAIVMIVEGPGDHTDIASVSNDSGEFHLSNISKPGRYVLQINGNNRQKRTEVNVSETDSVVNITY